jgi:hypothetical protein
MAVRFRFAEAPEGVPAPEDAPIPYPDRTSDRQVLDTP